MFWFWVWLAISVCFRISVGVVMLEEGMPYIETAIGRYFFLGSIFPLIGDIVLLCAMMYYGLEWASNRSAQDNE